MPQSYFRPNKVELKQLRRLLQKNQHKTYFSWSELSHISSSLPPFSIAKIPSKKYPGEDRYYVIGYNAVGHGGTASVFEVFAKLKITKETNLELIPKGENKYVAKFFRPNPAKSILQFAEKEYEFTPRHLKMRRSFIENCDNDDAVILLMHRQPGKDLVEILLKESLSISQRLKICQAVYIAWRDQVLKERLIHRDLKLDNTMISLTPEITANMIDYNLGKEILRDDRNEQQGSWGYVPLATLQGHGSNYKTELTAIAIMMGNVFGAQPRPDLHIQKRRYAENYDFEGIFNGIHLGLHHQMRIKNLLDRLYHFEDTLPDLTLYVDKAKLDAEIGRVCNILDDLILGTFKSIEQDILQKEQQERVERDLQKQREERDRVRAKAQAHLAYLQSGLAASAPLLKNSNVFFNTNPSIKHHEVASFTRTCKF